MRVVPVLLFSALVLLGPACALAQQAGKPDAAVPTLKVHAYEVLLQVTVRDHHDKLANNLTPADFTLNEDGRPQTIKSFSRQSDLPFRMGLLVDTSRGMTNVLDSERKAATIFVDSMLPENADKAKPGDQAFLIHFDREVELLEDFTNSRVKLDHELDGMGPSRAESKANSNPDDDRGDWSGNSGNGDGQSGGRQGGPGGGRRGGARSGGGPQLYDAIFLASDEMMKPVSGRKALVVFSDGVDRGSKESLNDAVDAADRAGVEVFTIYFKGEEEKSGSKHGIPGIGNGGGRGGMGGGWPGSGGGGWPGSGGSNKPGGDDKSVKVDGKKILEKISARTGGRFFEAKKKDSLADIYKQIAEELRGQYLLSYTPDRVDHDAQYHKIELKAKKDGFTVHTREGYFAPDEAPAVRPTASRD